MTLCLANNLLLRLLKNTHKRQQKVIIIIYLTVYVGNVSHNSNIPSCVQTFGNDYNHICINAQLNKRLK